MELILIRHGKAEERQEMTDDSIKLLWFFQPQPLGRLGETLLKNSLHRS